MAAHGVHQDRDAVLCSGCEECEWRATRLPVALAQMEPEQLDRAWRRAIAWRSGELIANEAERELFEAIDAFARLLSRRKVLPYGQLPGKPRPGFRLVLELTGTAMSDPADVALTLNEVAHDVRGGFPEGLVWDRDGHPVGSWSLTLPENGGRTESR
jgi:hypothetical protein